MFVHRNSVARWRRLAKTVGVLGTLTLSLGAMPPTDVLAQTESSAATTNASGLIGMLGLEWGMSVEQVLDLGFYTLETMEKEQTGQPYNASVFPPILHDIKQVILYFGFDDRLWRIAILGKNQKDRTGTAAPLIARYDEIRQQLADFYGPGEQFHHNTTDNPDPGFVLGSLQTGKAWHFSEFVAGEIHVQLGLLAGSVVAGHYALYLKNLILEEKVQADLKASQRLGADIEDPASEAGGGNPNSE